MQDDFLIEVFDQEYHFVGKAMIPGKKYEIDYMSINRNDLTVPGLFDVHKRNYIQIRTDQEVLQGIIVAVDHGTAETKLKYASLISILDVDVYKDRKVSVSITPEEFLATIITETFVESSDKFQNIPGLQVECCSATTDAALNLKDNIHNIYDLVLKFFRKYGITVTLQFDVMKKRMVCWIQKEICKGKTIEADLKNVLDVNIIMKEDDESVNKVIIIGEYDEENPNYGKILTRTYYLDKATGITTQTPSERALPVVFQYKVIQVDEETFEDDAFSEAYDLIYHEEYDNSIKIKVGKNDPLYRVADFQIGQSCIILKDGHKYPSIFTGYIVEPSAVTLLFGMVRVEYTKKLRRKR